MAREETTFLRERLGLDIAGGPKERGIFLTQGILPPQAQLL